jgi:superoxide dismutase, Fe-Mn family
MNPIVYKPVDFPQLKGLNGISDRQLEAHLELYRGYVTNTNKLNEQLAGLAKPNKKANPEYAPEFAELKRRLGFEYNGMILHELYFGNLTPRGKDRPGESSTISAALAESFGSWDAWHTDFQRVGTMRGVGWAIVFQDPVTSGLSNHWITLHEDGHPAGFKPLLVMDVWEHAFALDYKFSERGKYIEAFFGNIDWEAVDKRFSAAGSVRRAAA